MKNEESRMRKLRSATEGKANGLRDVRWGCGCLWEHSSSFQILEFLILIKYRLLWNKKR